MQYWISERNGARPMPPPTKEGFFPWYRQPGTSFHKVRESQHPSFFKLLWISAVTIPAAWSNNQNSPAGGRRWNTKGTLTMSEQRNSTNCPASSKGFHFRRIIHLQTIGSDIGRLIDDLIDLHITGTSNCSILYLFSPTPVPSPMGRGAGEGLICYLINHIKNADIHRAGNGAMAASNAQVHAKPLLVINKFMQGPLPPSAVSNRPWIVSSGHQREISVVAES